MIAHEALGNTPFKRSRQLKMLLDNNEISMAGNTKLKIYGLLACASGKKMKMQNRVFFVSAAEATKMGYRPCGHCMRKEYTVWKTALKYR
jgi:methylphosphotriester-DNA--protein-cysteine methyltransferase